MFYLITLLFTAIIYFVAPTTLSYLIPLCAGLIITFIVQVMCYYNHVEDIETIYKYRKYIDIYKEQANEVLAEIKIYMIDKFPELELSIFEKITSQTVDILAVRYPDLKSDKVFKKYIDSYIDFKSNIYSYKREIKDHEKSLRVRKKTIKLTVLPILPKL